MGAAGIAIGDQGRFVTNTAYFAMINAAVGGFGAIPILTPLFTALGYVGNVSTSLPVRMGPRYGLVTVPFPIGGAGAERTFRREPPEPAPVEPVEPAEPEPEPR